MVSGRLFSLLLQDWPPARELVWLLLQGLIDGIIMSSNHSLCPRERRPSRDPALVRLPMEGLIDFITISSSHSHHNIIEKTPFAAAPCGGPSPALLRLLLQDPVNTVTMS